MYVFGLERGKDLEEGAVVRRGLQVKGADFAGLERLQQIKEK